MAMTAQQRAVFIAAGCEVIDSYSDAPGVVVIEEDEDIGSAVVVPDEALPEIIDIAGSHVTALKLGQQVPTCDEANAVMEAAIGVPATVTWAKAHSASTGIPLGRVLAAIRKGTLSPP